MGTERAEMEGLELRDGAIVGVSLVRRISGRGQLTAHEPPVRSEMADGSPSSIQKCGVSVTLPLGQYL